MTSTTATKVNYEVRDAIPSDVPTLVKVINLAYRTSGGWTSEVHLIAEDRVSEKDLLATILDPAVHIFTIINKDTGRIIGSMEVEHFDTVSKQIVTDSPACFQSDAVLLGLLAIEPEYQSRGAGAFMMQAVLTKCRSMQPKKTTAILHVIHSRTELITWYMRIGFKPNGRSINFVNPHLQKVEDAHFDEYEMPL
ncbi:hypothetical protein BATDEDRAFT_92325 [Batrachochytrium dendrobatidis JAM81]|uniref:N-acetyltransferase domain-containing protein n=2 Tax=Batrachochytrium dendrobatidis TaxID=109871 RepID=F4PDB1_BATDJ|nr:uncharacterized protein BATDEDRAFT_92325 [Batrachochytrium dendrobatidis JAM81]EGF76761.1 hypothetical protein BATDEDRAFT_92325 [Batrachochytrium dendrobatidis JAM81]KAJ8329200.1 hypothetical protein O5D80_002624 [Batrachochytrium dendrobatidis]KAK5668583.1 hypothetical protein QVD99_004377 [Batrachochytrium dendrobatidis]OAJ45306.1 hypothetical protein BDEG_28456 [Batrachochytrium dendrobatidis JEL423]|eukprot:XP_006682714.1 hypothetical protein BATDEDRAFT_92325 [Batrachochytrium dendrobatidis JAM81]